MSHYMMGEELPARLALESATRSSKEFPGKDEAVACLALLNLDSKTAGTEASSMIDTRLRDVPDDPIARERLAAIQARAGAFEKAIRTYEIATQANPQNPQLKLELAKLYDQHMRQADKALELAKEAHKLAPDDPKISHFLGSLAFRTKDYDWAASLLQDSARKLQDDPEVLYDLAWSYFSLGKISEAQAAMQKCSAGRPFSRAEAANDFLELTAAAQEGEKAQHALQRAQNLLTSAPDYVPALLVCARVEESQAKYSEAAQLYQRILAQYPSFIPATRSLALLCFTHLNEDQRAYELATKVRQSDSDDCEVAKVLGALCYRRKDYPRAAQLLEESARRRSQDAEVFYYLGMARYQLNQHLQSKEKLQRALALNSAGSFADDARRVLQEIK
jgi:tetratricopeptide (TPR) repeat protein